MQIKSGSASVTNGSNIVTAAAGVDWSLATSSSFFSIDLVVGAPLYPINSRALVGGVWKLTLGIPYAEATNAAAAYLIQKDFLSITIDTITYHIPIFESGDTQTLPLYDRAMAVIIAIAIALRDRSVTTTATSIRLWNPDQSAFFDLKMKGLAGEEILYWEPST